MRHEPDTAAAGTQTSELIAHASAETATPSGSPGQCPHGETATIDPARQHARPPPGGHGLQAGLAGGRAGNEVDVPGP